MEDALSSRRRWNVIYTSYGLAGGTTSVAWLSRNLKRPRGADEYWLRTAPRDVEWEGVPLRLLHEFYANLWMPRLRDVPPHHPGYVRTVYASLRAAREFLKVVDGIVCVIDSSTFRLIAAQERLEHIATNLVDAGRDPGTLPVVLQLNKRDLDDICSVAELGDALPWPGPHALVESVAWRGHGVAEAMSSLIDLMSQREAASR